ncbi:AzlD domain-containing protein [Rhodovulum sulfidophilum]|uniref:AzlD domain-containing protein n=1 Tax=Rhodovulum sulfidophilum TaxID=35806 RepID=UPI0019215432|nr:AzlD domain-containing protein [Rhodovulum sulfidophilum]MBL3573458.1 AzlD domain-containing protein [Rhodovulum sulfidophilum]MCE8432011.1 AzlD domain-containing protein [Rhodovulum sulfidophilum]MCF4117381.1 AzlD domain-containing protein [Rhodovulum sulfidophilum]
MDWSITETWAIIVALGIGTFLLRFSFLGAMGGRQLPDWLLRHLRYTPVAVLPALVAPAVAWPEATGGDPDPARLAAAFVTVAVGWWRKSVIAAICAGAATLYAMLFLLG